MEKGGNSILWLGGGTRVQGRGLGFQQHRDENISWRRKMATTPFLGEFVGTLILILLGDGVVATVLLKRSKGEASGWMVITAGWAFAVMAGVFASIACGSKDAFLNPALTLGFSASPRELSQLWPHIPALILSWR